MKLFYLPLPAYRERYSEWLSRPHGVFEQMLVEYAKKVNDPATFDFAVVRPSAKVQKIAKGIVLDPNVMCQYGFKQVSTIVQLIMDDAVVAGDAIYIEDFWQPGIEMIPYALSLKGLYQKVRIYSHCHAQTADHNDFTYKLMYHWMPWFEQAMMRVYTRVFVNSEYNLDLMNDNDWPHVEKVCVVGSSFNSEIIRRLYHPSFKFANLTRNNLGARTREVVYSSRLDEEKDPMYFLNLVEEVLKHDKNIRFIICTSASSLIASDEVKERIRIILDSHREHFKVYSGLTKNEYYGMLCSAAVQINTAKQDFVSMTLLEATTFGCTPFYPRGNSSFEEALGFYNEPCLYNKKMPLFDVAKQLIKLVDWSEKRFNGLSHQRDDIFSFVYEKYDKSLERVFDIIVNDGAMSVQRKKMFTTSGISRALDKEIKRTNVEARKFSASFARKMKNG